MTGAPLSDASRVAAHLDTVRRLLRQSIVVEAQRFPVPLTAPQVPAMRTLVDHLRDSGAEAEQGLSVSQLSERMGLAHSTVSGIVTRLERHGLVERGARAGDRRYTTVRVITPVRAWREEHLPASRLQPLEAAMARATDDERAAVLTGLSTLERLLGD